MEFLPEIIDISSDSFHENVLHSDEPVVVEFFSHSCPHCTKFKPVYQELSEILANEAKFFRIDVMQSDSNRELAHGRGVRTVPTVEVFYKGRVIGSLTGYHHIKKVLDGVKECLDARDEFVGPGTRLEELHKQLEKEEEIQLILGNCQIRWCKEAKTPSKEKQAIKRKLKGMTRIIEEAMAYTKKEPVEEVRLSVAPEVYAVVEYCENSWHLGLETVSQYLGEVVCRGAPLICLLKDEAVETESI